VVVVVVVVGSLQGPKKRLSSSKIASSMTFQEPKFPA
jgi:hypothetical protein